MKDQIRPNSGETIAESVDHLEQNSPKERVVNLGDVITNIESDNDSGFLNASNGSLNSVCEVEVKDDVDNENQKTPSWHLKIPPKIEAISNDEIAKALKFVLSELDNISAEQRKNFAMESVSKAFGHVLPMTLLEMTSASIFDGDTGVSIDTRPHWLDMDKFRRGQKFAVDNMFGLFYSELLSLFITYSFEDGFKTILMTGNSNTPYACFKRYLSTGSRLYNWYTHDVWTPGNPGYEDMRTVRKMHSMVRRKRDAMSYEELDKITKIENPWCPTIDITVQDFLSTCPAPAPKQRPYVIRGKDPGIPQKSLNQAEMGGTQFAFVGLAILNPKFFGLHNATDEDLEAFCHTWRGFGYLLGIDDDFNFCRGTLEDVKARSRDFIEFWVKPNFRDVKPEWEHVMRSMLESLQYYFPGSTYETSFCDLAEVLNLHIPRFYSTVPYSLWIKHRLIRYGSRFPALRRYFNNQLIHSLEKAKSYDEKKLNELREKSEKTMNAISQEKQKCTTPMKECLQ